VRIRHLLFAALVATAFAGCTPTSGVETPAPEQTVAAEPTEGSSPTPTPTPLVSGAAVDPGAYAQGDDRTIWFDSPSGNIQCIYLLYRTAEGWGCTVRQLTITLPVSDGDCPSGVTTGFWVAVSEGSFSPEPSCSAVFDAAPVLPYGSSLTYNDMACDSTEDGVRCASVTSGHGFRLSRSDYELF
jgi:hypothetical protein